MSFALNALALEYQGYYGGACRNGEVLDFVNNPAAKGELGVLCALPPKHLRDLIGTQFSVGGHNVGNALLVGFDVFKPVL